MYTIKLSDGTKIEGLTLNGNNFVSKNKIEDSLFKGKLSTVEITNSDTKKTEVIKDAVLIQNRQYGDEWWFILSEKTNEQRVEELLETHSNNITDVEVALAEIYETMVGGMH